MTKRRETAGSAEFIIEVPWTLIVPDGPGPYPLIVGLHGMGHTGARLRDDLAALDDGTRAFLFCDGPLPFEVHENSGRRQGKAWYVFTGSQPRFVESMARTEKFLLELIDEVAGNPALDDRVVLLGYSQGGYLASFMGLRHAARFEALICVNCRMKVEVVPEIRADRATPLPVLETHGRKDRFIGIDMAREWFDKLPADRFDATFLESPSGHRLSEDQVAGIGEWMRGVGI